jgi:hypothetical protein
MKYERHPIVLNTQTIMLIQMFHRSENVLEDLWVTNVDGYEEVARGQFKESAKQLIEQLEGNCAPAFFIALRNEITKLLKSHDKKYKTKFSSSLQGD